MFKFYWEVTCWDYANNANSLYVTNGRNSVMLNCYKNGRMNKKSFLEWVIQYTLPILSVGMVTGMMTAYRSYIIHFVAIFENKSLSDLLQSPSMKFELVKQNSISTFTVLYSTFKLNMTSSSVRLFSGTVMLCMPTFTS